MYKVVKLAFTHTRVLYLIGFDKQLCSIRIEAEFVEKSPFFKIKTFKKRKKKNINDTIRHFEQVLFNHAELKKQTLDSNPAEVLSAL